MGAERRSISIKKVREPQNWVAEKTERKLRRRDIERDTRIELYRVF